jgi:hypothetical protein
VKRVLLVEADPFVAAELADVVTPRALVVVVSQFVEARSHVLRATPDLLVTNLRLAAFNGLHLVYLAARRSPGTRSIVYVRTTDRGLIDDIRRSGAFYEPAERIARALPGYLSFDLPSSDRRTADRDRRTGRAGGRRITDLSI